VASPAHDNADDGGVDAVPAEHDNADLRMAAVRGKTVVKEVDAAAGIDGIVEDV